jgi:hypothetical protein
MPADRAPLDLTATHGYGATHAHLLPAGVLEMGAQFPPPTHHYPMNGPHVRNPASARPVLPGPGRIAGDRDLLGVQVFGEPGRFDLGMPEISGKASEHSVFS